MYFLKVPMFATFFTPSGSLSRRDAIGTRLIVSILLASSLFTLLGTGYQLYADYRRDVVLIEDRMEQIRTSYLQGIVNSLWMTDVRQVEVLLEGVVRLPDMRFARILSAEGLSLSMEQGALPETLGVEHRYSLLYEHRGEKFNLGELQLVASLEEAQGRLWDRVLLILGTQAVKTFLVSGFIFILVQRMLTRHLQTMADFAHATTPETLEAPLQLQRPHRNDELHEVVVAFNRMRQTLSQYTEQLREELRLRTEAEAELKRYKSQLEQQVAHRTEELRDANERLREEVQERVEAGERLQQSLKEKEVLLQEVHHRVKNNMQIISSMLRLQFRGVQDPALEELTRELQQRVHTMSLIHERLYRSSTLTQIDFPEFVRTLARELLASYSTPQASTRLELKLEPVRISIDRIIPCGLILNELLTNSVKHAISPRQGGLLSVQLGPHSPGQIQLIVRDDGPGYRILDHWGRSPTSGLRLIHLLSAQIGGTYQAFNDSGACFELTFPEEA